MSKESWPEVVGMGWKEADEKIKTDYPQILVQVVHEGSMVTMDCRTDRVRVTIDKDGKVALPPRIG